MAVPDIRHQFVSLIDDTGDETIVQGSDWNEKHALMQGPAALLGRADAASGQGPTTEVELGDGVAFVAGKLSATATTLPPSGAAGGALSGTYPNPGLAVPYPTTLPPSGPAGGDLSGSYPNPTLSITSLPPGGDAGGVLDGTYPNPTFATQPFTLAMGGTGATAPQASAQNLATEYVVADIAALQALTSRPPAVFVRTGAAAGTWRWDAGSTTPVLANLVVQCPGGAVGRYKKVLRETLRSYDVEADFGAVGDGTADDTEKFQLAFDTMKAAGGRSVLDLRHDATYRVDNIVSITGGNVTVRGNGATVDGSSVPTAALFNTECAFLVAGQPTGTITTAAFAVAVGDKQLHTASIASFAEGDAIFLRSLTEVFPEGSLDYNAAMKGAP